MADIFSYLAAANAKAGLLLAIYGALWLANLILGSRNALHSADEQWDWKKFWCGIRCALMIAAALMVGCVAIALIPFAFAVAGLSLTDAQKQMIDITQLFAILAGAVGTYGVKFVQNLKTALGGDGLTYVAKNPAQGFADAQKILDTITAKSAKEQLKADGATVDDGEDVPGMGSSNTYPAPYATAAPDTITDPSTCYNRECVSYAAWKINECGKGWLKRTGEMNAKNWVNRLPENGYRQVSAPVAGGKYVGILTSGTYGHACWWESGNTVSEYNYSVSHGYGVRTITLAQYLWFEIVAPAAAAPANSTPAPATVSAPAVNTTTTATVKIGDRVTTTAANDVQTGAKLNLAIINDGQSVFAGINSRGNAVLTRGNGGAIRAAVNESSLRKI